MVTPQRILKLEYELPPRKAVSPEAHSLLAAMLVAQPEQRISIQQASLRCLAGGDTSTLGSGAPRSDSHVMLDQCCLHTAPTHPGCRYQP